MTPPPFGARLLALPIALMLAAGSVAALSAPASAAKTTYDQTQKTYIGDGQLSVSNTAAIAVPGTSTVGTASSYPSEINVAPDAFITDVNVTLFNVTHTYASDIDVLLVGPGGQQVTLMSDVGGSRDFTNANLTFSDGGAAFPVSNPMPTGTYDPANVDEGDGDTYPPAAPAPNDNTSLAVFDATSTNGAWKLFVQDDTFQDEGDFVGGWSLTFTVDESPNPSTLSVSGLPPVSDVNVRLNGLTTTQVGDINLLLVGPGGQQSYLMGDVSNEADDLTDASFTLDDEAPGPFPGPPTSLTPGASYQPANLGDIELFDGAPAAGNSSVLSVFDGVSPNGQWRLFSMDDAPGGTSSSTLKGWSLDFTWTDTQGPTGTVNVNGGAATTTGPAVTLNVNAIDPAPASGVTQMRFSNDGTTFSPYQAYAATAAWTLTSGDGSKTVYAQFRDADGNESAVVNDAITLALPDTKSPSATKLTPNRNAKGVKVTTKVKIKASEALKASTVNNKTVFLKAKGSSKKVKAVVKYNAIGKTIVLKPKSSLKKAKKYTVTVTTRVQDVAGNAFDGKPARAGAQALKFSFTTA